MKDAKTINKEREERKNLSQYKELIETISKVEYKKFSNLGLIDLSEVISLANYTVYYLVNSVAKDVYNEAYLTKAMKWAIRNEVRRRYKWYVMKNSKDSSEKEIVKDAVYKSVLSIEEMAEAENPTIIKDNSRNPEETAEIVELKKRIQESMKKLSPREQDLIEAKYIYDKKLKDISVEFNISQSRISRIIQNALEKVKKDLLLQERIDENNI